MTSQRVSAQVGDRLPERVFGPITRMTIARFSVACADPNLVHIDEDVAKSAGFNGVIASGGLLTGVMDDVITAWAGLGAIRSSSHALKAPLLPGMTVTVAGEVTDRNLDATPPIITATLTATDEAGQRISVGDYAISTE